LPKEFEPLVRSDNGEGRNESKTVIIGDKNSEGPSIKRAYPEEDGLSASLFTAKAVAACRTSLKKLGVLIRLGRKLDQLVGFRSMRNGKELGGAS